MSATSSSGHTTTQSSSTTENIVRPCGYSNSECGYCKGNRSHLIAGATPSSSSRAYGVLVDQMSAEVYEQFMYRGWRRSGIHLYKPCNFESCCPTLTIRLPVAKFEATKSQRKVVKKMESLIHPERTHSSSHEKKKQQSQQCREVRAVLKSGIIEKVQTITTEELPSCLPEEAGAFSSSSVQYKIRQPSKGQSSDIIVITTSICAQIAGKLKGAVDRSTLATTLLEKLRPKHATLEWKGIAVKSMEMHAASGQILISLQVNTLQGSLVPEMSSGDLSMPDAPAAPVDKLTAWFQKTLHRQQIQNRQLTITTIPAHESVLDPDVHKLYCVYQREVHNDPDVFSTDSSDGNANNNDDQQLPSSVSLSDLDWGNAPADWTPKIEAMLTAYFATYPESLKGSIVNSFYSFYQFLIESPFPLDNSNESAGTTGSTSSPKTGTFHQHYRIDGVLIAVGVIDILPNGVSSVYLFYHPSFSHDLVALGKLAIMKEIEYTQQLQLPYYYLGYYIESCQKMRYKGDYKPSELLCPTHYEWVGIEVASEKLKTTPTNICTLVDEPPTATREPPVSQTARRINLDIGAGMNVTMDMLQEEGQRVVRPFIEDFAKEAGSQLGPRCLVKLN